MRNLTYILSAIIFFYSCSKDTDSSTANPEPDPTYRWVELQDCEVNWTAYVGLDSITFIDTNELEYTFIVQLDMMNSDYIRNDSFRTHINGEPRDTFVSFSLNYLTIDLIAQGDMIDFLGIKGIRYAINNWRHYKENENKLKLTISELLDLPGSGSTTLDDLLQSYIVDCELKDANYLEKTVIANSEFNDIYTGPISNLGLSIFVNEQNGIVGLEKNGMQLRLK